MNSSSKTPVPDDASDSQQIERWVRRYAQNRTLPVAVNLAVFAVLYIAIALPSYWGGMAYRDGNWVLLAVCIGALIVAMTATTYLSVPRWGGQWLRQLAESMYAREGRVSISPRLGKRPWLSAAVGAFMICVTGSVVLGLLGYLPAEKYMQPISAIYCVPFLVAVNFLMRPATGTIPLLWPLLYGLHAVLIVAGAPIVFVGAWEPLNLLVPMVGYGLLTSLIGHLYSRWALYHVRTLAAQSNAGATPPSPGRA
jgi:hypothetical protein